MRFITFLISIILIFPISLLGIEISLYNQTIPIVGTRYIAVPISHDSIEKHVNYKICNGLFKIKAELKDLDIIYSVSANSDTTMQLSFCKDSVLNWNINNTYDLHSVKFKYEGQTYYFIPGTKISYNDSIYNQFPCMIAKGEIKQGWLNNGKSMVYILKDNSSKEYSIFINENGNIHSTKVFKGLNYKNEYSILDTIPIMNTPYIIEDLDWDDDKLVLTRINKSVNRKIDPIWLNYIFEGNDNKEYVFIDFWGTWCAPCIDVLPQLKDLYLTNKDNIGFLSICYDYPENKEKFHEILNNHEINWRNEFVSFNDRSSIIEYLDIKSFPSFLLINKNGEIVFFFSGLDSIPIIESFLKSKYGS